MRRRLLNNLKLKGEIDSKVSVAGDICMCDISNNRLFIVSQSLCNLELFPSEYFKPVGVVVVPGTHDVYGTGECGVMSLEYTKTNQACWGVVSYDTILTNYNVISTVSIDTSTQGYSYTNWYADLPSDSISSKYTNPFDTDTSYTYNNSDTYHAPSPYLEDDSRNINYYKITGYSDTFYNCLADFDGRSNTDKILSIRGKKDYTSWTPEYTNDYPVFSYCDMYYTDGTKQGDWYLPACGELGYLFVKLKTINNVLTNIISSIMGVSCNTLSSYNHLSSTEYNSNYARFISFSSGSCQPTQDANKKNYNHLFRPFLRVS